MAAKRDTVRRDRTSVDQVDPRLVARLRVAGCVFAEDEARLITAAATSGPELVTLMDRRESGEPLEHVLGWVEFDGLRIAVGPGVFVPRQRTVLLARHACELAASIDGRRPVVVDLCCGSGAIAAVVADRVDGVELHAAELDPVAVAYARRNVLGRVYEGDLFDALPIDLRGRVDVLVANVPYVPSSAIALMPSEAREHEQRIALDGGADGLDMVRRVIVHADAWLSAGGSLLIETSRRQADAALAEFGTTGFTARIEADDELGATIVIGTKPKR